MNLIKSLFFAATLVCGIGYAQANSNEQQTSVTQEASAVAPAAPKFVMSYNSYHFSLKGDRGANTNIYKFGQSTVDVNLLSLTWLYSADWTFVGIVPYITNKAETIYEPVAGGLNLSLTDVTKGAGDVILMAVTPVALSTSFFTMVDIGVSLPTGSIDEKFTSSPTQRASYNMQLGSGTADAIVGATVSQIAGDFTQTARAQGIVRGGKNKNDWGLGNELQLKASSFYTLNSFFSGGLAANYKNRGAVVGRDDQYELFNNYPGTVNSVGGDGHQYYKGAQVNWDANVVAKAKAPISSAVYASLELGLPIAQGLQNKDDVELKTQWYGAFTINGNF